MNWPQVIVHADMDAFYAAVEQRDHPHLRGKPLLIGPNSYRGVVLTASYEARPFGVGSGMPVAEARRRCPEAIMVAPRFQRYQSVSRQVMDIFGDFSPQVEALSLDEAFLDMTGAGALFGEPAEFGAAIKSRVRTETGLEISVGISGTKYVAKVASAHDKPNGLTVVPPDCAAKWLAPLPVTRLWGVGKKTAPRLRDLGLETIGDLVEAGEGYLRQHLGAVGAHFYSLALARDPRAVERGRGARSLGSDRTLERDVSSPAAILGHLRRSAERIARRLRKKRYVAGGVRVRLKTSDFRMLSRQCRVPVPIDTADDLLKVGKQLLKSFGNDGPYRLVGMATFDLSWRDQTTQLDLFVDDRPRRLEVTIDQLVSRFGAGAVVRARDLSHPGTVARDGVNLDFLDYRDGEYVAHPVMN